MATILSRHRAWVPHPTPFSSLLVRQLVSISVSLRCPVPAAFLPCSPRGRTETRSAERLHGCVLDAGLSDMLPPRASRKPTAHPNIKPHEAHVLSWPGSAMHVPRGKHFFKPDVDSRNEIRGELPPMAQLLVSAGARPGFPTCARKVPQPPQNALIPPLTPLVLV